MPQPRSPARTGKGYRSLTRLSKPPESLLLEGKNPGDEFLDVRVGHLCVRRHGNLTPDADTAFLDLVAELGERVLVAFVLRGDLDVGGSDHFLVDAVARRATVLFHHRFRAGIVERGVRVADGEQQGSEKHRYFHEISEKSWAPRG